MILHLSREVSNDNCSKVIKCSVIIYYIDVWTPVQEEILGLIHESTNSVDNNAAAVMKEGKIVGHFPFNLGLVVSLFLRRDVNKALLVLLEGK